MFKSLDFNQAYVRGGGGCLATFLPPSLAPIDFNYIYWYIDRNIYKPPHPYTIQVGNYGGNKKTHNNEGLENWYGACCHHTKKPCRRSWDRERRPNQGFNKGCD